MLFVKSRPRSSTPIIFFHGLFGCHTDGLELFKSSSLSCYLVDLPGHGQSAPPSFIKEIWDYIEKMQSPFHAVGYSLGGRVAQKMAHHPNCQSLTLISSQTLFTPEQLFLKKEQESNIQKALEEQSLDQFLDTWYKSPIFCSLRHRKRLYESVLNRRLLQNKEALLYGLKELCIENLLSELPPCPILGLYGMLDAKYQRLYTKLPEAIQVVGIERAGHALHLENPTQCLQILEQFISSLTPGNRPEPIPT